MAFTNPAFGFETFTFDSGWKGLSSITLEGFGSSLVDNGNTYLVTEGIPSLVTFSQSRRRVFRSDLVRLR